MQKLLKTQLEYVSFCIPRVETTLQYDYISAVIKKWNIGNIHRIKEIPLRKEPKFKRIIIDLYWNPNNNSVKNIKEMMEKKGSIKLVHDMPWFWKMVYTTEQSSSFVYQPNRNKMFQN